MKHSHGQWTAESTELTVGEAFDMMEAAEAGNQLQMARMAQKLFTSVCHSERGELTVKDMPISVFNRFTEEAVEGMTPDPNSSGG